MKKGFTVTEVLIIIAIVAIIAAIVVPNFFEAKNRAKTKEKGVEYVSSVDRQQLEDKEKTIEQMAEGFKDCGNGVYHLNLAVVNTKVSDLGACSGLFAEALSHFLTLHHTLRVLSIAPISNRGGYVWSYVVVTETKSPLPAEKPVGK